LHARIPTRDNEYFALKIGESVGMESHVRNERSGQCVKMQYSKTNGPTSWIAFNVADDTKRCVEVEVLLPSIYCSCRATCKTISEVHCMLALTPNSVS